MAVQRVSECELNDLTAYLASIDLFCGGHTERHPTWA